MEVVLHLMAGMLIGAIALWFLLLSSLRATLRDAQRYCWLKSYRAPDVQFRVNGVHMRIPPEQMDAMVDAAMARDREAA